MFRKPNDKGKGKMPIVILIHGPDITVNKDGAPVSKIAQVGKKNNRNTLVIGRNKSGIAIIDLTHDELVSRTHATIHYSEGNCHLTDNKSSNGTIVRRGNESIHIGSEGLLLKDGDEIMVGNSVLRFMDPVNEIEINDPSIAEIRKNLRSPISDNHQRESNSKKTEQNKRL
jgi:pSer/pThr/pTyr-binding forkhead associated (FHA) protein